MSIANGEEPKTDFQKFGEALDNFKKALLKHHPLFIVARKLLDMLIQFFPTLTAPDPSSAAESAAGSDKSAGG